MWIKFQVKTNIMEIRIYITYTSCFIKISENLFALGFNIHSFSKMKKIGICLNLKNDCNGRFGEFLSQFIYLFI